MLETRIVVVCWLLNVLATCEETRIIFLLSSSSSSYCAHGTDYTQTDACFSLTGLDAYMSLSIKSTKNNKASDINAINRIDTDTKHSTTPADTNDDQ